MFFLKIFGAKFQLSLLAFFLKIHLISHLFKIFRKKSSNMPLNLGRSLAHRIKGFHKIDFPFSFGQKNRIFRQEIKSKN
ncbi:MAG TPA: hypothetical protein DIT47_03525 [Flavobacteriaceae bacterium]|nr:hypothetical protein [Flavobacteriaceae bacterium]